MSRSMIVKPCHPEQAATFASGVTAKPVISGQSLLRQVHVRRVSAALRRFAEFGFTGLGLDGPVLVGFGFLPLQQSVLFGVGGPDRLPRADYRAKQQGADHGGGRTKGQLLRRTSF